MGEVIEMEQFRRKLAADQGFRTWLNRFREQFGPQTTLNDLTDSTLLFLATPGDENLYVIFDLVMGVRGWGTSTRFILDDLSSQNKQLILDLSLRLLDYCRFEILRRLKWVEGSKEATLPLLALLDLVDAAPANQEAVPAPALIPGHPAYADYDKLIPSERHIYIRRLIPAALAEFRQRLEQSH